jgi:hypothetical protein
LQILTFYECIKNGGKKKYYFLLSNALLSGSLKWHVFAQAKQVTL